MPRGCNGVSARARLVGHGALVPLASPAKQERFWYDSWNCGPGVRGEGTTRALRLDRFAADETQVDVAWTGGVSFRSGH